MATLICVPLDLFVDLIKTAQLVALFPEDRDQTVEDAIALLPEDERAKLLDH